MRVGVVGALAASFCLALTGEAAAACKLGKVAEFPITMHGPAPWTTVQIEGKDASFILDSGAFFSSLTPAKAAELGLRLEALPWGLTINGVGGEAANAHMTTVKTLTISGVPIPRVDFLVVGQGGGGSAGLLGENILHIADDEYDLAHGVVRLIKPIDCGRSVLAYWDQNVAYSAVDKLQGATDKDNHIYANVTVNGVRLRALLDTGANASVISSHAAARAGLTPQMEGAKAVGATSGIGSRTIRTWTVPVGDFKFGDEEVKNTRMQIASIELSDTDMLLGADFFLSHHVYVSNSQRMIYFTYNGGNVFNLTAPLRVADRPEQAVGGDPTAPAAAAGAVQAAQSPAPNATPAPALAPDEPTDADGYSRRGSALAARRDYEAAIRDFDKAIALAPDEARYYYQRSQAHSGLKQAFLAMADLDEALKRKPNDTDALLSRGELKVAGQDRPGAARDLDAASAALPVQADARLRLALDYERLERFDQVIAEIDRWIPAHLDEAQTPQAYNSRCWARANQGKDLDKALDDCNRAIRGNRTAGDLENRGLVYLRRGEYDRAIDDYDAALKLRPNLPWALYGRGVARTYKGDAAAGAADIAAAKALNPRIAEITRQRGILVPAAAATPAAAPATSAAPPSP